MVTGQPQPVSGGLSKDAQALSYTAHPAYYAESIDRRSDTLDVTPLQAGGDGGGGGASYCCCC